jgi:hypothetical protein
LDAEDGKLKEELRAIELVRHVSAAGGGAETVAPSIPALSPKSAPESPAGTSVAQDEFNPPQESTPTEMPVEPAVGPESPVERTVGSDEAPATVESVSEAQATSPAEPESAPAEPGKDSRPLKEQLAGATPESAALAVLRSWDSRLKPAKIAGELIAAGYPFPSGNARDVVADALEAMGRDNKVKKVKTIKGTYFTLR